MKVYSGTLFTGSKGAKKIIKLLKIYGWKKFWSKFQFALPPRISGVLFDFLGNPLEEGNEFENYWISEGLADPSLEVNPNLSELEDVLDTAYDEEGSDISDTSDEVAQPMGGWYNKPEDPDYDASQDENYVEKLLANLYWELLKKGISKKL